MPSGTVILLPEQPVVSQSPQVAIYARVSSAENRRNLEPQAQRVAAYCAARGYQVQQVVKEVGSGVNDSRPKFLSLLADTTATVIVVEHKDRATRFGFRYLETLLAQQGRRMEVVNLAENGQEDLIADLVAIVYSFSARLYGQRRAKRKAIAIQTILEGEDQRDATGGTTSH
ncbi:MAG: Resolvase domain protein [Ktedonobacterales bacterium]|nr:MAG: Resolvase domain protein [Ktedonobacterales bacterium]